MSPRLRLRAAHERTLESLYERHAADVYRYALMMLDSPSDAEDVTQTTFLNAYRALLRGERPRSTGAWLRTIAHNLCLQHFRTAARRPREVELEDEAAEFAADDQAFVVDDLTRALRQIPVNQRAALLMRELEGRPIAEIASILGVSKSAVETLLFRARRGVREQLEGGLTCAEAAQAVSRQLDGRLKRTERGALRAHLRECEECAHLARSLRAQRGAIKSLAAIPLPAALAWSKFGAGAAAGGVASANAGLAATGGAWLAGSVASKLAGAAAAAAIAAGVGYVAAVKHPWSASSSVTKVPIVAATSGRGSSAAVSPVFSVSTPLEHGTLRQAGLARGRPRRSSANRLKAAARSPSSPGVRTAASTVRPPTSAAARRGRSTVSSSHGRHRGPTGQAKRTTHRNKPGHPVKRTHPATPTHRAKPTRPAKPTQTTIPTTTTTTKHSSSPAHG